MKAQASLEFLMTYGWAILVVLVVIASLAYFGVLNPQQFLPRKCQFRHGIVCQDLKIDWTGTNDADVYLRLSNGLGSDIKIDSISFTSDNSKIICANPSTDTLLLQGQEATINFTCTTVNLGEGVRIKGVSKLVYTDLQTNFQHTVDGSILTDIE